MASSDTATLPMPGQTWPQSKTKDSTVAIPNTTTTTTTTTYRAKLNCVYMLVARTSGNYLCYLCATGTTRLEAGQVWKYGMTSQFEPGSDTFKQWRYTQAELDAWNVDIVPIYYGTWWNCVGQELYYLAEYFTMYGHLPPGNKIFA